MAYADPADRAALIRGLRSLDEINTIAELPGSQPRETAGRQDYTATRSFGPVEYRAAAICRYHDANCR